MYIVVLSLKDDLEVGGLLLILHLPSNQRSVPIYKSSDCSDGANCYIIFFLSGFPKLFEPLTDTKLQLHLYKFTVNEKYSLRSRIQVSTTINKLLQEHTDYIKPQNIQCTSL